MRKVMSVSIDEELLAKLEKAAKRQHTKRSELVKRALRQYLYLDDMQNIRSRLRPYAEKAGYFSDDDIYNDIS